MHLYGCQNLEEIIIPESASEIMEFAFFNCCSLRAIKIPQNLTKINHGIFGNCESLTDITIPENVSYICEDAFSGCNNLRSITMPDKFCDDEAFVRNLRMRCRPDIKISSTKEFDNRKNQSTDDFDDR